MDIDDFFNPGDGLTKTISFVDHDVELIGYFDVIDSDVYADGSQGDEHAQFICKLWPDYKTHVGHDLQIDDGRYTVSKIIPDGTGMALIQLFKD